METQTRLSHEPVVPIESDWPAVPQEPFKLRAGNNGPTPIIVEKPPLGDSLGGKDADGLSMDDIAAAQALEDLRADFLQAQSRQPTALPTKCNAVASPAARDGSHDSAGQPEPLLSLLTSQHPLLSTAINGSLSAWASSKSYSPRFKYGAEFVERHIGSPVASTVGTASRISGVETGVRWWLRKGENSSPGRSTKRRRLAQQQAEEADVEKGMDDETSSYSSVQRRFSDMSMVESLPPYEESQLPGYEEKCEASSNEREPLNNPRAFPWQARFAISTSGLGVSMREESLRSLKYCLKCLHWANGHLSAIIVSLHKAIDEWGQSHEDSSSASISQPTAAGELPQEPQGSPRDAATLSRHIKILTKEVLQTLNKIIDVVSTYAGGALPENARELVRKQLNSFPQRFRLAFTHSRHSETGSERSRSETVFSATRILVLAREGLEMMHQVNGVVDGTIVSAEEWLVRLGRKKPTESPVQESPEKPAENSMEKVIEQQTMNSTESFGRKPDRKDSVSDVL